MILMHLSSMRRRVLYLSTYAVPLRLLPRCKSTRTMKTKTYPSVMSQLQRLALALSATHLHPLAVPTFASLSYPPSSTWRMKRNVPKKTKCFQNGD